MMARTRVLVIIRIGLNETSKWGKLGMETVSRIRNQVSSIRGIVQMGVWIVDGRQWTVYFSGMRSQRMKYRGRAAPPVRSRKIKKRRTRSTSMLV